MTGQAISSFEEWPLLSPCEEALRNTSLHHVQGWKMAHLCCSTSLFLNAGSLIYSGMLKLLCDCSVEHFFLLQFYLKWFCCFPFIWVMKNSDQFSANWLVLWGVWLWTWAICLVTSVCSMLFTPFSLPLTC